MKTKEILKKYSDQQLIEIANELQLSVLDEKSELRKIAAEMFGNNIQVDKITMVAIPLAIELARRLEISVTFAKKLVEKSMLSDNNNASASF